MRLINGEKSVGKVETLESLWREAEALGYIRVWSNRKGLDNRGPVYMHAEIIAHTERGSELKAKGDDCPTIEEALRSAINEFRECTGK